LSTPNKNEVIMRVKHLIYNSSDAVVQTGAIDTIAIFGESAIDAINEGIGLSSISDGVKEHGLKTIEYIKENSC
jgi:hypothetical protein